MAFAVSYFRNFICCRTSEQLENPLQPVQVDNIQPVQEDSNCRHSRWIKEVIDEARKKGRKVRFQLTTSSGSGNFMEDLPNGTCVRYCKDGINTNSIAVQMEVSPPLEITLTKDEVEGQLWIKEGIEKARLQGDEIEFRQTTSHSGTFFKKLPDGTWERYNK